MFIIMICSIMTMLLSSALTMLGFILSKKMLMDREKNSPFECGFDPKSNSRLPFSLRFFLITIIFLIFDVEIALILPMIMILNMSNLMMWTLTSLIFIMILLLGLYHEWNQGMLDWTE